MLELYLLCGYNGMVCRYVRRDEPGHILYNTVEGRVRL